MHKKTYTHPALTRVELVNQTLLSTSDTMNVSIETESITSGNSSGFIQSVRGRRGDYDGED